MSKEPENTQEAQIEATRDFLENRTGEPAAPGPVNEDTARLPDNQNRLISQHNLRK
ncbi:MULTISPECIES: hypothetical protein [Paenibacillus]|uniref:hypothetical protein n=1 Tax=Paenibacillus TaxID=44249 RepID=UPI00168B08DC|nr:MULTISPECIES: hypothetical protein [Paenibacillus]